MDKAQAVQAIQQVTGGSGVDRSKYTVGMRGSIAMAHWNNGKFTLGVEYGYVLALMEAFDVSEADLTDQP